MAPNVQINGANRDVLNDSAVPGAQIVVQLCGYGCQIPRVVNEFVYANLTTQIPTEADDEGQYHFTLYSNDLIVPEGTYYTFTYLNENGDIQQVNAYRFVGTGAWDTSVLAPYDPNQPPPPLPPLITNLLLIVPAAANMVFDGSASTAFKTTLVGNVDYPVFENMAAGNLYTFIIVQGAAGGWTFDWAANVKNGAAIDPTANSITVQTFVADDLDNLYAIGPASYYP